MGIAATQYRFEPGPPTLAQLAERLSARCGLPVTLRESSPTSGALTIATMGSKISAEFWDDGALDLELAQNESQFVWTHLEAALTDLGGQRSADRRATPSPPAWTTRPWSQVGAWRRFTLRHRALIELALLPVHVALVPFWAVYHGIRDRRAGRLDARG